MENVSHTFCALALARAGIDRFGPWATAAVVLGANLPDSDIVTRLTHGQAGYLHHHRGITHSLLGLATLSVVIAVGLRALARARSSEAPPLRHLWIAAAVGLVSHLALDGLNTYGIRPWLPFSNQWYYGDVAFILDPWMWLLFGGAACLASPAAIHRDEGPFAARFKTLPPWIVFWVLAMGFMASTTRVERSTALTVAALWGISFGAVLALRLAGRVPRPDGVGLDRRRIALAGLVLGAVYLLALAALDRVADDRARALMAQQDRPVVTSTCHPRPSQPWAFTVVIDDGTTLRRVNVDLLRDQAQVGAVRPTNLDDPVLKRVAHTPEYAAWRAFARHPFVARNRDRPGELILGDGRYSFDARRQWCHVQLPDPGAGVD